MAIPRRMAGTLTQSAADAVVSVTRTTGVHVELFEAIVPLYFSFSIDPLTIVSMAVPSAIKAEFTFVASREKWRRYITAVGAGAAGAAVFEAHNELYVPRGTPNLYEEEVTISFDSFGTGLTMAIDYVFYYDIVKTSELEMLQEMSRYV